jgi:glucokinase
MEAGRLTIGVDLGGTKVLAAAVDAEGRLHGTFRAATDPERGFEGVVDTVASAIDQGLGEHVRRADGVGIGVAGQVDGARGVVHFAPNLRWHDAPLGPRLEERLGLPVVVTNDVRAAAWGEWHHGAGLGVDDLVVLFVGTGIGGGVVCGGHLLDGCAHAAGELGHLTIVHGGRRCRCRNAGCLEAYAGGWAIAERALEAVRLDGAAGVRLLELAGGESSITAATVAAAADQGDPLATRLFAETTEYLASGIVSIANAFNPCLLVLGGGVLERRANVLERLRALVAERALGVVAATLRIEPAQLGGDAGVIGAAGIAASAFRRSAI